MPNLEVKAHAHLDIVAAGLILRRETSKGPRWLLLRAAKHREWGFPKGHQEPGETLVQTALRECAEECGIALVAIDGPALEMHYMLPSGRQKRSVYFPALTSTSDIALSNEHIAADWFTTDDVIKRLSHTNLQALFRAAVNAITRSTTRTISRA